MQFYGRLYSIVTNIKIVSLPKFELIWTLGSRPFFYDSPWVIDYKASIHQNSLKAGPFRLTVLQYTYYVQAFFTDFR